MTTTATPATPTATRQPRRRRFRLSVAAVGALVGLLLAEVAARALLSAGVLPPGAGWINDEYAVKVAAMEQLAATGGASVVVLGSSVADTGIDPTRFDPAVTGDRPAYNAGLLGPTPTVVERWSAGWVEPLLTPDTAVVVVSSRDVNANAPYLEDYEQRFADGMWVRARFGDESPLQRVERWITERSTLVRHRAALRRPLSTLRHAAPALTAAGQDTHLLEEGYRIEQMVADRQAAPEHDAWQDYTLDPSRLDALRTLAARLDAAGTRVVLVDAPVTIDYAPLHSGGVVDYLGYRDAVTELAEDVGVELVVPGLWELDHFADPVHVNGTGAERLTSLVDAVLQVPATTDGGLVDLDEVPGAAALAGPTDPTDPTVPGPATLPLHGLPGDVAGGPAPTTPTTPDPGGDPTPAPSTPAPDPARPDPSPTPTAPPVPPVPDVDPPEPDLPVDPPGEGTVPDPGDLPPVPPVDGVPDVGEGVPDPRTRVPRPPGG